MTDPITFVASFPPIQGAIKTGRDGARIQLDIPASELPAIVRLMALVAIEAGLQVTIQIAGKSHGPQKDTD